MEFPTFSGHEDPLIWLHRCELYFRTAHTPLHAQVELAAFNMTGEAQLWYYQILRDEPRMTWGIFKDYCKLRFGPPHSTNPLGDLVNVKQRARHIDEYVSDFQLLLARADSVRIDQQVDLFTAGLDELLRIDVERSKPCSLAEAINNSRDFYRRILLMQKGTFRQPPRLLPAPTGSNLVTVTNSRPQAMLKPGPKPPPIRRLSPAEQEERKSKGLCFNCDETWSRGHRCKHLFCVLGINEEEESDETTIEDLEVAEISLHAITGVSTGEMMKLRVLIEGTPLLALVDTGSTHNFINTSTALGLALPTAPRPGVKVVVANGDSLSSTGLCEQVLVSKGSDSFLVNLFQIPLVGFDLVLGIQWLSTLGPIWWDFNSLTMQFLLEGKLVSWSSDTPHALAAVSSLLPASNKDILNVLLSEFDPLFREVSTLPPSRSCDHRIILSAEANMLYLESPAGVGFSYSANKSYYAYVNDEMTARDNLAFLENWFEKFPQYKNREFFITGESYAGHYVPQLAHLIVQSKAKINLKGIAVNFNARGEYFWSHGLISDSTFELFNTVCNYSQIRRQGQIGKFTAPCALVNNRANAEISRFIDAYDVTLDVCLSSLFQQAEILNQWQETEKIDVCVEDETIEYLNRKDVQIALHAQLLGVNRWGSCSDVLQYDMQNLEVPTIPILVTLVKSGIRVLVFSGDQDSVIPLTGTRFLVNKLAQDLGLSTTVPYGTWFEGKQVAGWTQGYGELLSFATIRGAAHEAPFTQPEREIMFLNNLRMLRSIQVWDRMDSFADCDEMSLGCLHVVLLLMLLIHLKASSCYADPNIANLCRFKPKPKPRSSGAMMSALKHQSAHREFPNLYGDDEVFGSDKRKVRTGPNPLHNR
nr:serine carboxypeptidase-like 45 [Ipomoea batatas]